MIGIFGHRPSGKCSACLGGREVKPVRPITVGFGGKRKQAGLGGKGVEVFAEIRSGPCKRPVRLFVSLHHVLSQSCKEDEGRERKKGALHENGNDGNLTAGHIGGKNNLLQILHRHAGISPDEDPGFLLLIPLFISRDLLARHDFPDLAVLSGRALAGVGEDVDLTIVVISEPHDHA